MSRAAIRYAKAVLLQAQETNAIDTVFGDMQDVQATLDGSKELRSLLKSPLIKVEDKKSALLQIFTNTSEDTKRLITVLAQNERADILGNVANSFINLYNEAKGVKVAEVTTAVELSSEMEAKVLAKVKEMTGSDNVSIENIVDESIIGGFILRVGDMQYNASIANQLGTLKREFSKSI
ncbi:ATP synthase F1 subunit delta [Aureisphaera galaxeae]|uniref:ATP synthase F1 subunit delta n=1 Tax=Aureisphaera galaxeae TaxID=1538023 RepID=UPI0023505E35|nr:ATP synthase F1 subunit delta [Aureisphaera galaxeae]MDC8005050.1 ATP synthase F1 subunit delta [Aureisphaera galaxeae]